MILRVRLLGVAGPPVHGVLVDLDDTLYPQSQWLSGACDAVAAAAAGYGVDPESLRAALSRALEGGSDRGGTIDRALADVGATGVPVESLVSAFRCHAPDRLEPYSGVVPALVELSARVPLALVSDGDPARQRAKLAATGLAGFFGVIVLSDELGRERRMPDAAQLQAACEQLGLEPESVVMVGDCPDKDVEAAVRAGIRALRVGTGEYCEQPDHEATWAVAPDFPDAARLLARFAMGSQGTPC